MVVKKRMWYLLLGVLLLAALMAIFHRVGRRGDSSPSCQQYYAGMKNAPAAAVDWCKRGKYFSWNSTLTENGSYGRLNVFYVCEGDPGARAIVLIHGYPTSSYDFSGLAKQLARDFYVCALDTPGYGYSDKPRNGYRYSIFDDARLVDHFIREVVGLKSFTLVTHDKGDSVGLALLQIYQSYPAKPYTIGHHVLTNGNIFLPLAQLSLLQKLLLNPYAGPALSSLMGGSQLAKGLARATYTPALTGSETDALASIFNYQDGIKVEHDIIQYLNERRLNEVTWLETLRRSDIPTALIWGEKDRIAPTAVADYVWTNHLRGRASSASYWRIPCANHYLQTDQPETLAAVIRQTIEPSSDGFGTSDANCRPYQMK
jgi:pimeloyl-ACP methyl ester carboxylesterase